MGLKYSGRNKYIYLFFILSFGFIAWYFMSEVPTPKERHPASTDAPGQAVLSSNNGTKLVNLGFANFFIPQNLTTDIEVEVLGSGILPPKGCQRWNSHSVNHQSAYLHVISAKARFKDLCVGQMIPFEEKINLGRLLQGRHTMRYLDQYGRLAENTFEVKSVPISEKRISPKDQPRKYESPPVQPSFKESSAVR